MPNAGGGERIPGVRSRPLEREVRPWGGFATLEEGPGFKVKRLVVLPGQRLSLQRHRHRAEHWVVVQGTATVVRGRETLTLRPRQCARIPRGAWHRLANRGRIPLVVVEVQHGLYLGEDDIVRAQDDYGRINGKTGAASGEPANAKPANGRRRTR